MLEADNKGKSTLLSQYKHDITMSCLDSLVADDNQLINLKMLEILSSFDSSTTRAKIKHVSALMPRIEPAGPSTRAYLKVLSSAFD